MYGIRTRQTDAVQLRGWNAIDSFPVLKKFVNKRLTVIQKKKIVDVSNQKSSPTSLSCHQHISSPTTVTKNNGKTSMLAQFNSGGTDL